MRPAVARPGALASWSDPAGVLPRGDRILTGDRCQLWFQVTLKFSPPDSAEVVALVVLPVAMLILSGP